jgi:hypothetical protein
MAQNKKYITPENITEWLASTGFLFPRNEVELARFEKLFGNIDLGLTGNEIDPNKIINGELPQLEISQMPNRIKSEDYNEYSMVARKGNNLPKHILDKIKKNQKNSKNDNTFESEE